MIKTPQDHAAFQAKAGQVAQLLSLMGSPHRLMVLCKLAEHGEMAVGDLAGALALSQSALSQHLGRMREEGLVAYRRERQSLLYRIADPRTAALLEALYRIYGEKG